MARVAWIGPAEPVLDQGRQGAGVVDVGVAQHHGVDRRRVERIVAVRAVGLVPPPLHQAAVEQDRAGRSASTRWRVPVTERAAP